MRSVAYWSPRTYADHWGYPWDQSLSLSRSNSRLPTPGGSRCRGRRAAWHFRCHGLSLNRSRLTLRATLHAHWGRLKLMIAKLHNIHALAWATSIATAFLLFW